MGAGRMGIIVVVGGAIALLFTLAMFLGSASRGSLWVPCLHDAVWLLDELTTLHQIVSNPPLRGFNPSKTRVGSGIWRSHEARRQTGKATLKPTSRLRQTKTVDSQNYRSSKGPASRGRLGNVKPKRRKTPR